MFIAKHLTVSMLHHLRTFVKQRKKRRAYRKAKRTLQQKIQVFTIYLFGTVIMGWLVLQSTTMIHTAPSLAPPMTIAKTVSPQVRSLVTGDGGKGSGGQQMSPRTPASPASCDPFDTDCIANSFSSWAAQSLVASFTPLTDGVLKDPADIIYQTPATDSYSNQVVMNLNGFFVGILDTALACMLIIGAYNIIWGHHLQMPHTPITELIPRAILVVGAVHFNLVFLGMFVDFANELSLSVIHFASEHMLTDIIHALLTNTGALGLSAVLLTILVILLGILVVMLLIQRIGTIALIALLLSIAPLGLACFLLPQTMRWGRLWLSMLSSALVTQMLQVTTICLGGMFITSLGLTKLFHLDQGLANAFLALGTMLLVLKIPGMLQTWTLQPPNESSSSSDGSGSSESSDSTANDTTSSSGGMDASSNTNTLTNSGSATGDTAAMGPASSGPASMGPATAAPVMGEGAEATAALVIL